MENKTSNGYEQLRRSEYEITGNTSSLSSSKTSLFCHQGPSSEDIRLEDYSEQEIFVLSREYVRMEGEYIL